ncbi:Cop9 signalosome complex subunit [Aphelenchoides avenae]|nr:Cop9 signalosome complex subunit [Aphelenchus avenae]
MEEDDSVDDYTYEDQSDPAEELEELFEAAQRHKTAGEFERAMAGFECVLRNEMTRSELGFRALAQLYQIAMEQEDYASALLRYHQLLDYATIASSVPRTVVHETICGIISQTSAHAHDHAEGVLAKTSAAFENDRDHVQLWVMSKRALVELWLEQADFDLNRVCSAIEDLHLRLKDAKGSENQHKVAQLWDIYALQRRLVRRRRFRDGLEELYDRVVKLQGEGNCPEKTAFTKECSAYVHFHKRNYSRAYRDFFEAFSSNPAASDKARCLATAKMLKSPEIWKDVFQPLSRRQLDPTGIVCRSWRGLADGPAAPARHFIHVAVLSPDAELIPSHTIRWQDYGRRQPHAPIIMTDEPYDDSPLTLDWNVDSVVAGWNVANGQPFPMELFNNYNRGREQVARTDSRVMLYQLGSNPVERLIASPSRGLTKEGPFAELMVFLAAMTRHCFVEHFYLAGPTLSLLAHSLSPQFFDEVTIKTVVYGAPLGHASAEDAAVRTPNLVVASQVNASFMTDAFLAECVARGVSEIRLLRAKPRGEGEDVPLYPASTDAVFDFCFSTGDRGGTRTFNAWRCEISGDFIDRVLKDSESPLTADAVELRFFVPSQSPVDRALQATLRKHAGT